MSIEQNSNFVPVESENKNLTDKTDEMEPISKGQARSVSKLLNSSLPPSVSKKIEPSKTSMSSRPAAESTADSSAISPAESRSTTHLESISESVPGSSADSGSYDTKINEEKVDEKQDAGYCSIC